MLPECHLFVLLFFRRISLVFQRIDKFGWKCFFESEAFKLLLYYLRLKDLCHFETSLCYSNNEIKIMTLNQWYDQSQQLEIWLLNLKTFKLLFA